MNKKATLIKSIKSSVFEMINRPEAYPKINFSTFLSSRLNYDYTYLANLFSEAEGTTIEHFILIYKIEKVKELMLKEELSLTQIAKKLHYSSVAHLSNQFKKITGLTASAFKSLKNQRQPTASQLLKI